MKNLLLTLLVLAYCPPVFAYTDLGIFGVNERNVKVIKGDGAGASSPWFTALHGGDSNPAILLSFLDLAHLADMTHGYVMLPYGTAHADFPNAAAWDVGGGACCIKGERSGATRGGDLEFIHRAMWWMVKTYGLDITKNVLIGHSNGAFMEGDLACHYPGDMKAMVVAAGSLLTPYDYCESSIPLTITQVYGSNDIVVPPAGGTSSYSYRFRPVATMVSFLKSRGATYTPNDAPVTVTVTGCSAATTGHCLTGINAALAAAYGTSIEEYAGNLQGLAWRRLVTTDGHYIVTADSHRIRTQH